MTRKRHFALYALAAVVVGSVLLLGALAVNYFSNESSDTETATASPVKTVSAKTVSYEIFAGLKPGMLFTSTRDAIGWQGELLSDSTIGDARFQTMRWTNPDGSYLECTFKDGDLKDKRQHGLK